MVLLGPLDLLSFVRTFDGRLSLLSVVAVVESCIEQRTHLACSIFNVELGFGAIG
jgi:hypothetical protein